MESTASRVRPEIPGAPGAWRMLRTMQILLVAMIVALAAAGRDEDIWPVVTWPVYSLMRPEVPGPTVTYPVIRVALADGDTRTFRSEDLIEHSRSPVVDLAVEQSLAPDDTETRRAWRDYLATLVLRVFAGRDVVEASVWQITWAVDPWEVPPLERDAPLREERILALVPRLLGATEATP